MKCDQVRQAFSDLYDERLSGPPLVTITQHLATCQDCRAEWADFRKAMLAVSDLGRAEPSLGFAARVRRRIETPTRFQRFLHGFFFPIRVKVPIQALALLLVAFAGVLLYQRSPELRRGTDLYSAPAPPVGREVPVTRPAPAGPPVTKPPAEERLQARPSEPVPASPPRAALEGERDRAAPAFRDEVKPLEKPAPPADVPKTEETARESRAKTAEPDVPVGRLRQVAPPAAESGGPAAPSQLAPKALAVPQAAPKPREAPASGKEAQTSAGQLRSADELYFDALADSARQRYDRSIEDFRAFIDQHPRDTRVPEARLRLADAYVAERRLAEAVQEYETLVREFPGSPLLPAALFKLGQARLDLGDRSGCQSLRNLIVRYPQAPEAALARETLSARCP
ncbi:MAG TPA: tetratricopeptide repeat protein [Candidatus Methylomirabilis sp.]